MKFFEVCITSSSISRSYKLEFDDDFGKFIEKDLKKMMGNGKFLDAKVLLNAFLEKSYENYQKDKIISELISNLDVINKNIT